MLFTTYAFFIFIVFFFIILNFTPKKYRIHLLLSSSLFFYGYWNWYYLLLIIGSATLDYLLALKIESENRKKSRIVYLKCSIFINLGILGLFKYSDFVVENLRFFVRIFDLNLPAPTFHWLLPVGISFYTFQTIGYTIDVYKRKITAEKNYFIFLTFVSFFPQLVAGPIEKAQNLIPQLKENLQLRYDQVLPSMNLIMWGVFKKVVIADRLAMVCDSVYSDTFNYNSLEHWIAVFFAAFMYYADFSGYCDIALGISKIMGVKLSQNFNRPFIARSMSDFWKRWHITMTNWFKEYLGDYLKRYQIFNSSKSLTVLTIFTIIGLWHEASWSLVLFGFFHGLALLFDKMISIKINTLNIFNKIPAYFRNIFNNVKVFAIWLIVGELMMIRQIEEVPNVLGKLFSFSELLDLISMKSLISFFVQMNNGFGLFDFYTAIFSVITLLFIESLYENKKELRRSEALQWGSLTCLILIIICFGTFQSKDYLYFQF